MSFLKKSGGFQRETFGLDIGYETLKVAQLKKKGQKYRLLSLGKAEIPPALLQKTGIKDKKSLSEAIKKAVRENHISASSVVSALPESLVFTKIIQLPKMPPEELKEAIPYEAASFIPLDPAETCLDFSVIKEINGKLEILVIATSKTLVEDFINLINEMSGLKLVNLETKPLSLVRALVRDEKTGLLIFDLGAESSSLTIYDQGLIQLTSTVNLGGNSLTKAISSSLKLSQKEAEKRKREKGLKEFKDVLSPLLNSLLGEAANSLKYYQSRHPEAQIKEIKLAGGGANLSGLSQFIEDNLKIKTHLGNPFLDILNPPKEKGLEYTTALGLAKKEV